MIDLRDKGCRPTLEEFGERIANPLFARLCAELRDAYRCRAAIEYSSCSWKKGWNVKFKKGGKTLCTVYPEEGFFTVLVVIGQKEKARAEEMLADCTERLREIYRQTPEGNGQRWLMLDLEDPDELYRDVMRLIRIRVGAPSPKP